MKLKLAILAVAALAVMAFVVPSVASAAGQATFGAGLVYGIHAGTPQMGVPEPDHSAIWQGQVRSPTGKCAWKRLVTVWLVRPGADKKIGSARSKRHIGPTMTNYDWFLHKKGYYLTRTQRYYVKMAATSKCDAAREWLPRARVH